jgi:hypothetical protein
VVGPGETLGSPWPPLAIRPCRLSRHDIVVQTINPTPLLSKLSISSRQNRFNQILKNGKFTAEVSNGWLSPSGIQREVLLLWRPTGGCPPLVGGRCKFVSERTNAEQNVAFEVLSCKSAAVLMQTRATVRKTMLRNNVTNY